MASISQAHAALRQICFTSIDSATFSSTQLPGGSTTTSIMLDENQRSAAAQAYAAYRRALRRFLVSAGGAALDSEVNLLRANCIVLKSYVLMRRYGDDTSPKLYKRLFKAELGELLDRQLLLCEQIEHRWHASAKCRGGGVPWFGSDLTIGIEEELQIVDSSGGWDLVPEVDKVLSGLGGNKFYGIEVYKSQVELKTEPVANIKDLMHSLRERRKNLLDVMPKGLAVLAAGTHPFSRWGHQEANRNARTEHFIHDMQDVVRRLVTFGLHIHIGIEDHDLRFQVARAIRPFLPLLLALSASSPFWEGRATGLASFRTTIFSALPRTGLPPAFTTSTDYQSYLDLMAGSRVFDEQGQVDATKIWWDLRLHPNYPTIEIRICDAVASLDEVVGLAAFCQALIGQAMRDVQDGRSWQDVPTEVLVENRWRASRYGTSARFVDVDLRGSVPLWYTALQAFDRIRSSAEDLGALKPARRLAETIRRGCSARRQAEIVRRGGNLGSVVQALAAEYQRGVLRGI